MVILKINITVCQIYENIKCVKPFIQLNGNLPSFALKYLFLTESGIEFL